LLWWRPRPVILEEVLIRWGWRVTYKDEWVCVLDNPKDHKCLAVCIPQKASPVDSEIQNQILFDAKLDDFPYLPLRAAVMTAIESPAEPLATHS
jgi:hypothetical protein